MKCRLCNNEKELIGRSHIIPNFMHKGLFDEKHRIQLLDFNNPEYKKYMQTGFKEGGILCKNCDGVIIGRLEKYASVAMHGGKLREYESPVFKRHVGPDGLKHVFVENINYEKYKLFLLSILWRAHISKLPFFENVDLGPYAEVLRKKIYEGNAGDENEFQTCLVFLTANVGGLEPIQMLGMPRKLKDGGNTCYVLLINGMIYHYNISDYNKKKIFEGGAIRNDNTMNVPVFEGQKSSDFLESYFGRTIRLKKEYR